MTRLLLRALFRFHRPIVIGLQLTLVMLANALAFTLRFDGRVPEWGVAAFWQALPWVVTIRAFTFIPFRLHQGLWKYTSIYDLQALVGGIVASSFMFFLYTLTPFAPAVYPRSILVMDAVLLLLMLGGLRLTRRIYAQATRSAGTKRVLIFGAGDAGELIVRDMRADPDHAYEPIGFIDDDRSKLGRRIHGVPVLGSRVDIEAIVRKSQPDEILLAIPTADPTVVRAVVRSLQPFKIPLKTLPNLRDIISGDVVVTQIRSVSVEDLLARAPIGIDRSPLEKLIRDKRVLVSGAGGSIGSELCRQIQSLRPSSLVMLDRYENSLHAIVTELVELPGNSSLFAVIGDVTDQKRVNRIFETYSPEIVFHAAAHKHVPLMESSPSEAIKNNVRGTRIMAEAADQHGVDRFILISTDKAVNPTSVMGATKRVAELIVRLQQHGSGTSFATVRFGNVLASNGSVVPRFVEQIKRGGPITVTHPEMRRFFMLIPEAVQLVLHAAAQAQTGATYVLEMGDQVKLVDMARDMIRLSGLVPDEDIAIQFIGLRPGEKLYEELVAAGEKVAPSGVEKILKVTSSVMPDPEWAGRAAELERLALEGDDAQAFSALKDLLVEFRPHMEPMVSELPEDSAAPTPAAVLDRVGASLCPACREPSLRRSRARNWHERLRKNWSSKRTYRCDACGWRDWLLPMEEASNAMGSEAHPDLEKIDHRLAETAVQRTSFSPRDLK